MNQIDPLEAELRKLSPAKAPEELMSRLESARKVRSLEVGVPAAAAWRRWFRWLAPVAAGFALILLILHLRHPQVPSEQTRMAIAGHPSTQTKNVEFNQELVAAFDAVGRLPGGEPVRFRCREWRDFVTVRDPSRGLVIEQQTPRLEIVPVSFDTY
jgi:hypothetical protein